LFWISVIQSYARSLSGWESVARSCIARLLVIGSNARDQERSSRAGVRGLRFQPAVPFVARRRPLAGA
jgi:hypothetical protein